MATVKRRRRLGQNQEEPPHIQRYPIAYFLVWTVVLSPALYVAATFPELTYWALGAVIAMLAASSRIPGAEYRAFVKVLGLFAFNTWGGPVPIIPWIMELEKYRRYLPQWQFPADPDHVFHDDDKRDLPKHPDGKPMVRPLRLMTGAPSGGYSHPTLNVQIATKATGTIRAEIRDAIDFSVRHVGETEEEKVAEAEKQLNDTWLKAVQREWGQRPAGLIIDEEAIILRSVRADVDTAAFARGMDIHEVTVLHPDLSHDVSKELAGIASANARAIQTRKDADAKRYKDEQDGKAQAQVLFDREQAETDAARYRADMLEMEPRELVALETAVDIVGEKTQFVFGADGIAQAVGTGLAVADKFKKVGRARRSDPS